MHIAFWSPAWPLEAFHNGIVTYVDCMKRELERRGHCVSIFTPELQSRERLPGVYHVRASRWHYVKSRVLSRSGSSAIFNFASVIADAILSVHRRHPIDLIEMEEGFGWFSDVERIARIPVLVKLHGPAFLSLVEDELSSAFSKERIAREGDALRRARIVLSPTESTLNETIRHYGLTPAEARVIPNPLSMREDLPIWNLDSCDRRSILFVGRFDLRKGADILLAAFALLLESYPDLRLVLVGPDIGIPEPNGAKLKFEAYCRARFPSSMRHRLDYKGPMSNRAIEKLRVQAMATVIPSRWESQGYTLLEAMLQGCPVISSDAQALRESVAHRVTGCLSNLKDPVSMAEQLREVLEDERLAVRMGRAAREYISVRHSALKVVDAELEIYGRLQRR